MLNYKVKNTPSVAMPSERRQSPAKVERRKGAGAIDIAAPEESFDDEIESVEDPTARNGKKSTHLRDLHALNKSEASKAIKSLTENSEKEKKINSMIGQALS